MNRRYETQESHRASERSAERFLYRQILPAEAEEAAEIEQICFPPNEACSREHMRERAEQAPDCFLVVFDREEGRIAGFLNGLATEEEKFRDEFFTDISLHDPAGRNIMLLGLDVLPDYRGMGLARELVRRYGKREAEQGRKELILTCLPEKVDMYRKFGFLDAGIADSSWGGEQWHEMILPLRDAVFPQGADSSDRIG